MAEEDWLFDYVLQFLESEKFDSVVMDFIDENCEAFDNEEENKFEYSTIHREFKDMVETMIESNLGELGVSVEMFFEACQKGRNSRDINQAVVERMIAMDDFLTFKKIMVKRNMELQLEAMKAVAGLGKKKKGRREADEEDEEDLVMSAEDEAEMERIIRDSIMEMEMFHIQAEMEAIEMERVLAMSLALEEEKLNILQTELEEYEREEAERANEYYNAEGKNFKDSLKNKGNSDDESESDYERQKSKGKDAKGSREEVVQESKYTSMPDSPVSPERGSFNSPMMKKGKALPVVDGNGGNTDSKDNDPPSALKPLKMRQEFKPLPSIHSSSSGSSGSSGISGSVKAQQEQVATMAQELDDKRREVERQFKLNQQSQQKRKEQQTQLMANSSSKSETDVATEARIRYMKEQRDRILEKKRAEREQKVIEEQERARKAAAGSASTGSPGKEKLFEDMTEAEKLETLKRRAAREDKGLSDDELRAKQDAEESKRAVMRQALAQRMKMDMLTSNLTGGAGGSNNGTSKTRKEINEQNKQFQDLDEKLRQMDQLREDQNEELAANHAKTIASLRANSTKKY